MGSSGAVTVAAPHIAFNHEDHVGGIVPVSADYHAGVVFGVARQILRVGREGEPLLPDRRCAAVGVSLRAHFLPGHIGVVKVAESRLHAGDVDAFSRVVGVVAGGLGVMASVFGMVGVALWGIHGLVPFSVEDCLADVCFADVLLSLILARWML